MLAAASGPVTSLGEAAFWALFPHRFDYIYAPYSNPSASLHCSSHCSPHWQTERRHPLTDRLLQQSGFLYGVRFGPTTQYCLLDIDTDSRYHPHRDPFAVGRIVAALEPLGLVSHLACTSSYSGGLHLYLPFSDPQPSWQIGAAVTLLLERSGFLVKPGQLEVFPNRRSYSVQGQPSLFNAHRLPLQVGSYLLNSDFEPIWADRAGFVRQWQFVQERNQISGQTLQQILKTQRRQYRVSGKAAKFLNDLNTEIELGWTGSGQTNYLLGRITLRAYVFHHILTGEAPLAGRELVAEVVKTARQLPGYEDWCQHQHELEQRAEEWASCIESSRYFHYGYANRNKVTPVAESNSDSSEASSQGTLSWNQQQCQTARQRIQDAVANLINQRALPATSTARFKLLTACGIGGSSLYKHKDLWHPEFIGSELNEPEQLQEVNQDTQATQAQPVSLKVTSLFAALGRNCSTALDLSGFRSRRFSSIGCNCLQSLNSEDLNLYLGQRVLKPPWM